MKRVTDQPGVEIARTRNAKVFKLQPGKFRTVVDATPLHWHDGQTWQDIDLEWTLAGGRYEVASASYLADFDPETYTLRYRSRTKGDMQVRLATIDGVPPVPVVPQVSPGGDRLRSVNVAAGVILVLIARPNGPELMRRIEGPNLPEIVWEVDESADRGKITSNILGMSGLDNIAMSAESRKAEALARNQSRLVQIELTQSPERVVAGRRFYSVTEKLTGQTQWRDPSTRAPEWRAEIAFPVLVDVQVVEDIAAGTDDGYSFSTYWYSNINYAWMTTTKTPAWRFQTVAVPQGATIDNATLRVDVDNNPGDMTAPLYGNNVDNAASWAHASVNGPNAMAKTTANVTFNGFTTNGVHTRTVTTIIQEIVNRAGWAQGAMRLGCTTPSGADILYFLTFEYSPSQAARLTIDYTAAGGGPVIPVLRRQYRARVA